MRVTAWTALVRELRVSPAEQRQLRLAEPDDPAHRLALLSAVFPLHVTRSTRPLAGPAARALYYRGTWMGERSTWAALHRLAEEVVDSTPDERRLLLAREHARADRLDDRRRLAGRTP